MSVRPSTIERLGVYQRLTGLKSVGRHRRVADKLLRGLSHSCSHCGGEGYRFAGRSWVWCQACGGLGRVMTPIALLQLKHRVDEKFPGSGLDPGPEPVPLTE